MHTTTFLKRNREKSENLKFSEIQDSWAWLKKIVTLFFAQYMMLLQILTLSIIKKLVCAKIFWPLQRIALN